LSLKKLFVGKETVFENEIGEKNFFNLLTLFLKIFTKKSPHTNAVTKLNFLLT